MSETVFSRQTVNLPLVAAQPGIWMADQLSPFCNAYAVAHYVVLQGQLDVALLCQAIRQGMQEADTLNLRFFEQDGDIFQSFDPSVQLPQPVIHDLRREANPQACAEQIMQQDLQGDLRLLSGHPLIHHALLQLADDCWYWYQRYHHLQVDGFSFTAITRRMADIYTSLVAGATPSPNPFTPFSEVVAEYQAYRQSVAWQKDRAYWQAQKASLPPPASISPVPLVGQAASVRLIRQQLDFDPVVLRQLIASGQADKVSAADRIFALLAVWLTRLSGVHELSAGFIFMRRLGSAALSATGPVINVLPLALKVLPEDTLLDVARRLAETIKQLRRHQRYEAEDLLRDWGYVASDQPLYGPVINLKMFDFALDFAGIKGITHHLAAGPVRDMELALYLDEHEARCRLEILANADRYDAASLNRHLQRLQRLLQQFAAKPQLPCGDADLLDPAESALLAKINATSHPLPDETLASLLAKQASATPSAPALADEQQQLDYRSMRVQVLALAAELLQQGVQPGDVVAVALPRSIYLSLALQAVVSVGAAYLPLDTGYPDERLYWMLEDARPRLLITDSAQKARFSRAGVQTLVYETLLPALQRAVELPQITASQTAYVIFTSGSTGRPKGVMVSHQAIVNRLLWMQDQYPLTASDHVLQKTPCSFDVSVWEFFWPLLVGARLVMAPPEAHRDPETLQQLFARWQITTTHFVPSMLAAFVGFVQETASANQCRSLRQVFCSGEALPTDLCRHWEKLTGIPLHNLYGPTEAAVDVSWYPAYGEALAAVTGSSVPIGFPVWNTGLRLLDDRLHPVPPGVPGDLYLTGVQLAQGYLGRPDLTAARFVADPFAEGQRMYRTGDVARWLDNGALEYLGRSDDQLKIRGQRIELDEIDEALRRLPGVRQAATVARVLGQQRLNQGDERQLVGYLVLEAGCQLEVAEMRRQLAEQLPPHMLPVTLVALPGLPLSANGKLDRKALPEPNMARLASNHKEPPRTPLEQQIAIAFADLLGCDAVMRDDDFFALGGHSLLAMRLAARLRRELAQPVSVGQIMGASTLGALAEQLGRQQTDEERRKRGFEPLLRLREARGPRLFCFHPASGFAWQFSVLLRHLATDWSLTGIQSPHPEGALARSTDLQQVITGHYQLVRSVQPHGPYHFLGYSLGGTLAQGVASRLQQEGENVAFLGLLDTWPPETQSWSLKQGRRELNPEILEELHRERALFEAALREWVDPAQDQASLSLFDQVAANYASSVRLLSTANSSRFDGQAVLFVARETLPGNTDAQAVWAPWVENMSVYEVDCSHVDIISPRVFQQLGPILQTLLGELALTETTG